MQLCHTLPREGNFLADYLVYVSTSFDAGVKLTVGTQPLQLHDSVGVCTPGFDFI